MFYSHTFLARKGPLGTVWCAAHLEHRLKKANYISTDIPSTVERIMYPEVPIALRMLGPLLLGVVRIYSKKVHYLHQDCNIFLISIRKAFATTDVNLPEDATRAPVHSVTLPDTFNLEDWDLEDDLYDKGVDSNHLRSQEEITLADQVPVGRDPYITITFDKEALKDLSRSAEASASGARPQMEEDTCPSLSVETPFIFRDPGLGTQTGVSDRCNDDSFNCNIPEMEVLRDAGRDIPEGNIPVWPDLENDVRNPDAPLQPQIINEKEILMRDEEGILVSGGRPQTHHPLREPHSSSSDRDPDVFDAHISFGHASPDLVLRSTPPVAQPKPRPQKRKRKRKQLYDESPVLTNKFMKATLENSSDILRKRKYCPSSKLDVWRSYNRLKKDKIFLEPLMTGLCADLSNIYNRDFISAKPHLVSVEEACPDSEPNVAQSPPLMEADIEIERLRNYEGPTGSNILPEIICSPNRRTPSPTRKIPSPYRGDDSTHASAGDLGSHSDTELAAGVQRTPDLDTSTVLPIGLEMETPITFLRKRLGSECTGLSDIPEVVNSAEADELDFLASEDFTPTGPQKTEGLGMLSVTTRKVAQYLKGKSSVTPSSEDLSGNLTLNKILEGKRRKVCARMVFETLVLQCCGLVDVVQEEPYGNINLQLKPELFKDRV